jgi:G6PDH family F420-dependent oxidoreductase
MPGRFRFGVGSGEALNEHIFGDAWPRPAIRLEMLEEAVEVIRLLWSGEVVSHRGPYYILDRARIYSLPDELPPIIVSAFQSQALELAARIGEGFATTKPDAEGIARYRELGGKGPPRAPSSAVTGLTSRRPSRRRIASGRTSPLVARWRRSCPSPPTSRLPPSS